MSEAPGRAADDAVEIDRLPGVDQGGRRGVTGWLKSAFAVLLSLAVLIGGGYFAYTKVVEVYQSMTDAQDYEGTGDVEVIITIPPGASAAQMGDILLEKDIVASSKAYFKAVERNPEAIRAVQAAQYRMYTKMAAAEAVKRLGDPRNIVQNFVTVPEGLRNDLVFQRMSETTGVPLTDFQALAAAPEPLELPAWSRGKTEGFLFPNTYSYDDDPTAQELLGMMTSEFKRVTTEIGFEEKAQAHNVDPYDAVTIASIIEREVHAQGDRPNVSQVIYNRLRIGMPLQMDSTVHYANNASGQVTTTDDQRAIDSPYNTYKYPGLPPGAISNPGKLALDAAVSPTTGELLYFVTVNLDTGETKFATSYEAHLANVAEFQAWCQANTGRC